MGDSGTGLEGVTASDELAALLDERARYEKWLEQLDARASSTPASVIERVRGDYTSRLNRVLEEIGGRASELRSQLGMLETKRTAVDRELTEREEQRAEAELRHMVGEYTEDQWREIKAHSDEEIARASAQRMELGAELDRIRDILNAVENARRGPGPAAPTPAEEAAPEPPAPAAAAPATDSAPEPRVSQPHIPAVRDLGVAEKAEPEPARASVPVAVMDVPADAEPASPVESSGDPVSVETPSAPVATIETAAPAAPALRTPDRNEVVLRTGELPRVSGSVPVAPPATVTPPRSVTPPAPSQPVPERRASGFDDLAFVSSLLTPEEAARRAATPQSATPPATRASGAAERQDRPTGPQTPASFLKGVQTEQVKSLKCQECGTMNYPTEWYCERCGGELAAL